MNILAFDTSLNKTYLAIKTEKDIYSKTIESTEDKYHSAFLIKTIVEMMETYNISMKDINLISTNVGPGSFTGIRAGLTIARTLSQGLNINAVSINSLELISLTYGLSSITILDARKNKAYVGNQEKVELLDLDIIPEILFNYRGKIIADTKMQAFLKENNITSINFEEEKKDYGKVLINIAENKFNIGQYTDWKELKALYIQPPPIHVKTK